MFNTKINTINVKYHKYENASILIQNFHLLLYDYKSIFWIFTEAYCELGNINFNFESFEVWVLIG